MTIGEKIRRLRKDLGMTQTELGEKLGVKTNAVSKWECGRVEDIPRSKIKAMSVIFGVPASYLIEDDTNIVNVDFGHGETRAKKAPSQRDEADEIAEVFRQLDEHGKGAVRCRISPRTWPSAGGSAPACFRSSVCPAPPAAGRRSAPGRACWCGRAP